MGQEIDASRGKIIKSSPIGRLNHGFGNTELVLNSAVHKFLLTVFTINQLIPIIIWQL